MSLVIFKYHIPMGGDFSLEMPQGAKLLCVQKQYGDHKLWALVDTDAPRVQRRFTMYGTGIAIQDEHVGEYVATAQFGGGGLVLHLFDLGDS